MTDDYREWMKVNGIDRIERRDEGVLGVTLVLHRGEGETGLHVISQFVPIGLLRDGKIHMERAALNYMVTQLNKMAEGAEEATS